MGGNFCWQFENDVNRYGTQTSRAIENRRIKFENDVNRYGTQTKRVMRNIR